MGDIDQGLRRCQRLRNRADFDRVRREGRTFRGRLFTMGVRVDSALASPRLGIITGRKLGPAVVRSRLRRYSMRLDGFASLNAGYAGGEMVTRPFIFSGSRLRINFATSAAGGIRFELQDPAGKAIPGFALADCREQIGNEIAREVAWKGGANVAALAGRPVRLRVSLKDADLFAFRFGSA